MLRSVVIALLAYRACVRKCTLAAHLLAGDERPQVLAAGVPAFAGPGHPQPGI